MTEPGSVTDPEGVFEWLHARLGDRYVSCLLVVLLLSIPLGTVAISVLSIPYLGLSFGEYLRTCAVIGPWMLLVGVAAAAAHARIIEPLRSWSRAGRPAATAPDAWHAAVTSLPRAVLAGGIITLVGLLPMEFYTVLHATELGVPALLGTVVAGTLCGLAMAAVAYLVWERALRPVVLDLLAQLPADFRTERKSLSLSSRLLMVVPIVCTVTALIATALVRKNLDVTERIVLGTAVAVGVAALVALPLTLMLRRSLLGPMEQMLAAMDRVERGDFQARLRVMTGDELGTIAQHFNSMVGGLERLSGENQGLQARVRAQLEEVIASRARIIAASDAERRRVERNIHDGAQQRLVALALELRLLEHKAAATASPELMEGLAGAEGSLGEALAELRDLARGLHPQILTTDGLAPAIKQLAGRAPVPVSVTATKERFPDPIESTAYFVVSEALANVAKYSEASCAQVSVERENGRLTVAITDDGVGGADPSAGSGLSGLVDRVAALDGRLSVTSTPGEGTDVRAELPLREAAPKEDQY